MTEINQTDEWMALEQHWAEVEPLQMRDLFQQGPERAEQMSIRQLRDHARLFEEPYNDQIYESSAGPGSGGGC